MRLANSGRIKKLLCDFQLGPVLQRAISRKGPSDVVVKSALRMVQARGSSQTIFFCSVCLKRECVCECVREYSL